MPTAILHATSVFLYKPYYGLASVGESPGCRCRAAPNGPAQILIDANPRQWD